MNPIRRKMSSFLTEAAYKEIEALNPESPPAEELSKIEELDNIVKGEIEKICGAATLAEITRILLLVRQLNKASGQKEEAIKSDLKRIAEQLVRRVETESGPLRLSKTCRHLLLLEL